MRLLDFKRGVGDSVGIRRLLWCGSAQCSPFLPDSSDTVLAHRRLSLIPAYLPREGAAHEGTAPYQALGASS